MTGGCSSALCLTSASGLPSTPLQAQHVTTVTAPESNDSPNAGGASGVHGSPAVLADLRDIVHRVLRDHPAVLAARARLEAARFNASAALWGRYPSLSVALGGAVGSDRTATLQLTQPLWTAGRITAEIAASEARAVAGLSGVREAELALAEQLVGVILDVLRFSTFYRLADENVAAHVLLSETIERRAVAGIGIQSDLGLALSRTEQAKATRTQWRAALRRTTARFGSIAGFELPPAIAAGTADRLPALPRRTLSESLLAARQFSPGRARLEAEALAADHDTVVANARLWPQLSLRAEHINNRSANAVLAQSDTRVMAILEYQPGAGLGAIDRARAAGAVKDGAAAAVARLERELDEKISGDHGEASELEPRIAALELAVKSNGDVIDSFMRQYDIGRRTWLDILNAQNEYAATRQALAEARFAADAAYLRIAVLTGEFFLQQSAKP